MLAARILPNKTENPILFNWQIKIQQTTNSLHHRISFISNGWLPVYAASILVLGVRDSPNNHNSLALIITMKRGGGGQRSE